MSTASLNNDSQSLLQANDSIVIVDNFQSIRGGKTLDTTLFLPTVIRAGHPIIRDTATRAIYKPMPATDVLTDGVASFGTVVPGTGYTNGTYENVPLTGGTGTGVLATVVVASTVVSTITMTYGGSGYTVGDSLAVPAAFAGGTATTPGSAPVATIATTAAAFGALPSGYEYCGILIASILTKKPFAGIMLRGNVNYKAMAYSATSILAALKTALPLITFTSDEGY